LYQELKSVRLHCVVSCVAEVVASISICSSPCKE